MKEKTFTVWLKAPVEFLVSRVKKRDTRPLLRGGDLKETIEKLLAEREPVYAEADMVLEYDDESHSGALDSILEALTARGLVT
jgi:shikimate kinase